MLIRFMHILNCIALLFFVLFLVPNQVHAEQTGYRSAGWVSTDGSPSYTNLANCQKSDDQFCSRIGADGMTSLIFGSFGNLSDFGISDKSIINKILVRVKGKANTNLYIQINNSFNNNFINNVHNNCKVPSNWAFYMNNSNIEHVVDASISNELALCISPEKIDQENLTLKLVRSPNYYDSSWFADIDNLEVAFDFTPPNELTQAINSEDLSGTVWQWDSTHHNAKKVNGLKDVVSIASGWNHSMAVKSDGTVWVWGSNSKGQFGDGNVGNTSEEPVQVKGPNGVGYLDSVKAVAGGREFSMALKKDGTVWIWGNNWNGLRGTGFGNNDSTHKLLYPAQVKGLNGSGFLSDILDISAGYDHSLALKSDKTILSWGDNYHGQLGIGCNRYVCGDRRFPDNVKNINNVSKISTGFWHSTALKNDGTIWAWGRNHENQLTVSNSNSSMPVQVSGLANIIGLSSSVVDNVVLTEDSRIFSWGSYINTPIETQGLGSIDFVSMGSDFRLALQNDGTVWKWWPSNNKPYKIKNLTNVTAISGGGQYSPSLAIVGTAGEVLGDSDSTIPKPFLSFPYDYKSKGIKSFDEVALDPESWLDHEYPLADVRCFIDNCPLDVVKFDSFGVRTNSGYRHHNGYDFGQYRNKAEPKTPVLAAAAGEAKLILEAKSGGYGNLIKITHPEGYQTWYGHLDDLNLNPATEGASIYVNKGDKIGEVGNTGGSTGYHLHFTVIKDLDGDGDFEDDKRIGVVDPLGWKDTDEKGIKYIDPWTQYKINNSSGSASYNLFIERMPPLQLQVTKDNGGELVKDSVKISVPVNAIAVQSATLIAENASFDKSIDEEGNIFESIMPSIFITMKSLLGELITTFFSPILLTYNYSNADISNIDQDSIQFYYFNEEISKWEALETKEHDRANKIISAETDHFSRFALMGKQKDSEAPETNLLIDDEPSILDWYNKSVNVKLEVNDHRNSIGIGNTFYSTNYTEEVNNWNDYLSELNFSGEGKYHFVYFSMDKGGNREGLKRSEFGIDKTFPITNANIKDGVRGQEGWYTSDVTIELGAQDGGGSGVDRTEYSVNDSAFEEYSGQINIFSEGKNEIIYRSIDNAGNIEEDKLLEIKIDKTSPDTKMYYTWAKKGEEWFGSDVKVSLSADDAGSGVKSIYYKLNDGEYAEYFDTLTIKDEGSTIISYYSVDSAGNVEGAKSKEFKIDKTYPVMNIMVSPEVIWPPNGKMVDVRIMGGSSDINLVSTTFKIVDEYKAVEPLLSNFGQTVKLEAKRRGDDLDGRLYEIQAEANDLAGNISRASKRVIVPHDKGN